MKILLTTLNAKYIHTNLAIRLLFQLNKHRDGLEWKEFTINQKREEVADFCADFDVIAFSCYIWNITQTLEAARLIKQMNPHAKILLGGPEVSYDWQDIIEKEEVDFIITGEGETPFNLFLENYPAVDFIPNLVSKKAGAVQYFQQNDQFDLTNYREIMPYADDDPVELGNKVLYIETSRGCPYKCEFCLASLDNKVRYLPDPHIKSTLLFMMQNGRVIKFLDRTFNIKRDFTIDIFTFILANRRPGNVFQFEITADILHADIIRFIDENVPKGLLRFEIGIQTVNQKSNLEVSRKQNFDKTKGIIEQLRHKIEMHLDLIVGLPLEYWDDLKYSFEEVFRLHPPELQLGFLKFLKGTPMLHKHEQHDYIFDPNPPYQIIESRYLSREELHQMELLEQVLEIYWNKKRAFHTLKYAGAQFGIFDFFLKLGNYFAERQDFHKYDLLDVYEILYDFSVKHYPGDKILCELIAVDYYGYFKIKPKQLFLEEVDRIDRNNLIQQLNLNHHKYRFAVLPLSFDFDYFEETNEVVEKPTLFILKYDGVNKPERVRQFAPELVA